MLPIFITKVILVNISFLSDEGMLGSKIALRKELLSLNFKAKLEWACKQKSLTIH